MRSNWGYPIRAFLASALPGAVSIVLTVVLIAVFHLPPLVTAIVWGVMFAGYVITVSILLGMRARKKIENDDERR